MFVYAENIYTRNLFTKSSRIFCFHDEVMHPPLPICIVPGFVQVSWCACDVSGRTGYPRKKLDLQASIFLEYLILSHLYVYEIVKIFFLFYNKKMMYINIALQKSMIMMWMFHLSYTPV